MQRRALLRLLGLAAAQVPVRAWAHQGPPSETPANLAAADAPQFFFNQVGYLPGGAKVATVRSSVADEFRLLSAHDGRVALTGRLGAPNIDEASGDLVRPADFSNCQQPGEYLIEINGHRSESFSIDQHVYAEALRLCMRSYYGQRCGCAVDLGDGYQHPACHKNGSYHPSSGKSGNIPNTGGWHDAGDYGRYVVNSGLTCGTLLWAWELHRGAVQHLSLGISKEHGHLPDYLEEILWNLKWMLSLQDSDGGVFHKQTSDRFCAFIMPQDDALPSQIIGTGTPPYKSTAATADLAAVMAIASRCYAEFDSKLSTALLEAARRAWRWAGAHPEVTFRNPAGVATGEYGDRYLQDEIQWASAELWRTTGEQAYEQSFLKPVPDALQDLRIDPPSWATVGSLAYWTYAISNRRGNDKLKQVIRDKTRETADRLIARSLSNGYGNTLATTEYGWGSNGGAGNHSLLLSMADYFAPHPPAVSAALGNLHYLMGRNCHGVSFITHVGKHPFQHPHHRPSAADGIPEPWPGLLSGGPNSRPGDNVAKTLPKLPPMRMWVDNQGAYSMNEVAINWNAPLVFLLARANRR